MSIYFLYNVKLTKGRLQFRNCSIFKLQSFWFMSFLIRIIFGEEMNKTNLFSSVDVCLQNQISSISSINFFNIFQHFKTWSQLLAKRIDCVGWSKSDAQFARPWHYIISWIFEGIGVFPLAACLMQYCLTIQNFFLIF